VIGECLKSFVEEEWANLWIKITRNNLFHMESDLDGEEEKVGSAKQRTAHLDRYGTYSGALAVEEMNEEDATNALKSVRYAFSLLEHD